MRRHFRFSRFVCLGISSLTLVGCGDSDRAASVVKDGTQQVTSSVGSVKSLLDQATQSLQQRQWQPALQSLSEAIRLDPKCSEAFFQRGSLLADAGQPAAALADFAKAIELSPDNAKLHHTRGFLLMTQSKLDDAVADFSKTIELDPKHTQAFNNRGLAWLAKGDVNQALADFNDALKIDGKYTEALINRGFALYRSGKHKQALADYDRALTLNPNNVNALNNRGLAFFELEDFEKAANDFTQATTHDRYNAKFYLQRRECWLKLGRDAEAQADAAKVAWLGKLNQLNRDVAQKPKVADNYVELAEHLISGGEQRVGLASFEQAIKMQPDHGKTYSSRAAYWLSQEEPDKAIADCKRALEVEPHFEAYSIRGDAYFQKGEFDRAIADYQKAKRLDPQVAQAYLNRAKARRAEGRTAEAAKDIERAYSIDPSLRPEE